MSSHVIERKVKGGKLLRLRFFDVDEMRSIQLTGDFFLDPEEGIDIIESCLIECLAISDKYEAETRLSLVITEAHLIISGFEASDIIDALWEAKS